MNNSENKRVKRTQRDYNLGFKLALVSEVEKGNYTYKQIQKVYGIQGTKHCFGLAYENMVP